FDHRCRRPDAMGGAHQPSAARCRTGLSRNIAVTQPLSRDIEIEPQHSALLIVDVQNFNCSWDGGEYAHLDPAEKERRYGYFFRTLEDSALPNMVLLQQACRRA